MTKTQAPYLSVKITCLMLIASLPIDLLFLKFSGGFTTVSFSLLSYALLISGIFASYERFQSRILAFLVAVQNETLLSESWRIPAIAGAIILLSGLAEAGIFFTKLNPVAIFVGLWIFGVTIFSITQDLRARTRLFKSQREREQLLTLRAAQQSKLLHCAPIILLRLASLSLLLDISTNQGSAFDAGVASLGCLALMLIYFPKEEATKTHCLRCRVQIPRESNALSACPACSAEEKHKEPVKLGPPAKTTSTLTPSSGEFEKLLATAPDGAFASLRAQMKAHFAKAR